MAIERADCPGDCTCASRQARPWRSSLSADAGRSLQYIAARVLPHPFGDRRKRTRVLSHRTSELLTRQDCQNRAYGLEMQSPLHVPSFAMLRSERPSEIIDQLVFRRGYSVI